MGKHNATYSAGFSIQDMPVSSAIMSPLDKAVIIHDGKIHMRGWAYSGGGHWPERESPFDLRISHPIAEYLDYRS